MVTSEKILLYFTNLMVYTFLMLTHCLHCNVNYFVLLFYFQLQQITNLKVYLREDRALWEPYWVLYLLLLYLVQ